MFPETSGAASPPERLQAFYGEICKFLPIVKVIAISWRIADYLDEGVVSLLNHVVLIGHITRDAELRYTAQGTAVASFGLAIDRPKSQGQESHTDFMEIVCFHKLAEALSAHLHKGRLIGVQGRLATRRYQSKSGENHKSVEIVAEELRFLDPPREQRLSTASA